MSCEPPLFFSHLSQKFSPYLAEGAVPDKSYWSDKYVWEMRTVYRELFLEEMGHLQPQWLAIYNAARVEREIEEVILDLSVGWAGGKHDIK